MGRLHPGVSGDVLLEFGDEFRGKGAPGLADGVQDVVGGDEFLAVLEQDALEGQLRGAAGGEFDVGRGEQPRFGDDRVQVQFVVRNVSQVAIPDRLPRGRIRGTERRP
jgi:hypothetical protein